MYLCVVLVSLNICVYRHSAGVFLLLCLSCLSGGRAVGLSWTTSQHSIHGCQASDAAFQQNGDKFTSSLTHRADGLPTERLFTIDLARCYSLARLIIFAFTESSLKTWLCLCWLHHSFTKIIISRNNRSLFIYFRFCCHDQHFSSYAIWAMSTECRPFIT